MLNLHSVGSLLFPLLVVVCNASERISAEKSNFFGNFSDVAFVLTDTPSCLDTSCLGDSMFYVPSEDQKELVVPFDNVVISEMLKEMPSQSDDRLWALLGASHSLVEYLNIYSKVHGEVKWIFFVPDLNIKIDTDVLKEFVDLQNTNTEEIDKLFFGRSLLDGDSVLSAMHHYDRSGLSWPDSKTGFMLSFNLLKQLTKKLNTVPSKDTFNIDPPFELAKYLRNQMDITLIDSSLFCYFDERPQNPPRKSDTGGITDEASAQQQACIAGETKFCLDSKKCLSVAPAPLRYSSDIADTDSDIIPEDEILYAIKTHTANHKTRVNVLKRLWVNQVKHFRFYSDSFDAEVPTVEVPGIENTERGHCGKTEFILREFLKSDKQFKWLYLADDDTLLNPVRVRRVIHSLDPTGNDRLIIGERYGFNLEFAAPKNRISYSYPTLGCGMVVSRTVIEHLLNEIGCRCWSLDSPDDMWFGSCLNRGTDVRFISHPGWHQEPPKMYHPRVAGRSDMVAVHRFDTEAAASWTFKKFF